MCVSSDIVTASATAFIAVFTVALWRVATKQSNISRNQAQLNQRDLLFKEIEQLRRDLESWANEMFVCTVPPFNILQDRKRENDDYNIVQQHAIAGMQDSYIRHMVSRHVQFPERADHMSKMPIDPSNRGAEWIERFRFALERYRVTYAMLKNKAGEIDKFSGKKDEMVSYYEQSLYGRLDEGAKTYFETHQSSSSRPS